VAALLLYNSSIYNSNGRPQLTNINFTLQRGKECAGGVRVTSGVTNLAFEVTFGQAHVGLPIIMLSRSRFASHIDKN